MNIKGSFTVPAYASWRNLRTILAVAEQQARNVPTRWICIRAFALQSTSTTDP